MEVDSVGITAILSMSYITTRIVENQITTRSVVKIAIKLSPIYLKLCKMYSS